MVGESDFLRSLQSFDKEKRRGEVWGAEVFALFVFFFLKYIFLYVFVCFFFFDFLALGVVVCLILLEEELLFVFFLGFRSHWNEKM